ncbi:hypothetical protein TWF730_001056 [Orbilia blumenaviensis]|uniref:DNA polymerase lambda n=1 Tax=Orbilia blumenaviensis TaxID=1796055 RepID=A0AAV9VPI4_9PEZI
MSTDEKREFFDTLIKYSTDSFCNTDDEPSPEDQRLAELFSANRRARNRALQPHSNTPQHTLNPIATANIDINTTTTNRDRTRSRQPSRSVSNNIYTTSDIPEYSIAMPKRKTTEPPASSATSSTTAKRPKTTTRSSKSKASALQPASRRIFSSLTFFFIKPSEKRPERKMRIEKAKEYGATVVFELSKEVTHIIVDSDLKYQDVLTFLETDSVPAGIAVTNPRWAGDCIKHLQLLDPADFWYQVPGCPTESQLQAAPAISTLSPPPLQPESSPSSSLQVQPRPTSNRRPSTPPGQLPSSSPIHKDALDEAIEECLASPPMNLTDLMSSSDTESPSPPSSQPSSPKRSTRRSKTTSSSSFSASTSKSKEDWQSHFQCMHKHDGLEGSQNPNTRTIQILTQMMQIYSSLNDQWRTRSYRTAITTLKKTTTTHITTYESAISLPGIGSRLAQKIVEIATTDRLQRLEYAKLDPQDQLLSLFHGIYGVGLVQARKFVAAGYTTLEDLKTHATLTEPQRIGIERYYDFKQRIPREEVARHGEIVSEALKMIDEKVESHIMGSYRRGAKDCGDIDIILTKPSSKVEELHEVLEKLVKYLFEIRFLMCGLAIARHDDGTKWHGASKLPGEVEGPWRRIDFLVVPGEEIGAAFLYFTGNDVFNRSMRLLASRKGMRLNQRGLYKDVMRGKNREKISEGTLLESKDEKRIFEILGVPYRPPEHRIC